MPVFSSMESDTERFVAFNRVFYFCVVLIVPISFGAVIAVGPVMELLWGAKWVGAVYTAQLLSVSLFIPIIVMLSYSLLEASGYWKLKNVMQVSDGIFFVLAAGIGAMIGGLDWIIFFIILRRLFFGLFQLYITYNKVMKKPVFDVFQHVFVVVLVSGGMSGFAWWLLEQFEAASIVRICAALLVIAMSSCILALWKCPREFKMLLELCKR